MPPMASAKEDTCATKGAEYASDASIAPLPSLHFGLRQLFFFVAVVSSLLAAIASSSNLVSMVLLLAAVIVAMHVFATALGSRLSSRTDVEQLRRHLTSCDAESIVLASQRRLKVAAIQAAPRSPWHARGSTVLPWLNRLVIGATCMGGVSGASYLAATIGYRTSPAGVVVGGMSVAVLCGWFAFLCGSFYGVFRHGFREALADQQKDMQLRP